MSLPIGMYANHGYSGNVALTVIPPPGAPFTATLSNSQVPLNGGAGSSTLNVSVPANAKPGSYSVVVQAKDAKGNTAQTTVTIASSGAPAPAAAAPPTRAPSGPAPRPRCR